MRVVCTVVLTLAAVLMTVACSSEEDTPRVSAPQAFVDRSTLPSCGETAAKGPDSTPTELYPQSAVDCLMNSRYGKGAELSVTAFTTEGDPIRTHYRTAGNASTVEVFLDRSGDGGKEWVQILCEVPTITADALRTCTSNY